MFYGTRSGARAEAEAIAYVHFLTGKSAGKLVGGWILILALRLYLKLGAAKPEHEVLPCDLAFEPSSSVLAGSGFPSSPRRITVKARVKRPFSEVCPLKFTPTPFTRYPLLVGLSFLECDQKGRCINLSGFGSRTSLLALGNRRLENAKSRQGNRG